MGEIFVSKFISDKFREAYKNPDMLKNFCNDKYFYIDHKNAICLKSSNRQERSNNIQHFTKFKNVSEQILQIVTENATELE